MVAYPRRQTMKIFDRYSGEDIGDLEPDSHPEMVHEKVNEALMLLRGMEKSEVATAFSSMASIISHRKEELSLLVSRETGKPVSYCIGDVDKASGIFRTLAAYCKRMSLRSDLKSKRGEILSGKWTELRMEGRPVVLNTISGNAFLESSLYFGEMVLYGAPLIVNVEPVPSLAVRELSIMASEAGFPPDIIQQVGLDRERAFQEYNFPFINSEFYHEDSPVLIMEDGDLDFASEKVFEDMITAGLYGSTRFNRLLIEESCIDYVKNRIDSMLKEAVFGDPRKDGTELPDRPIFTDASSASEIIPRTIIEGCRVIFGDVNRMSGLVGLDFQAGANKFQVTQKLKFPAFLFGGIGSYDQAERLLGWINNRFSLSVYTRDYNMARMVSQRLDFQFIEINDTFDPILGFEKYTPDILERISCPSYGKDAIPLKRWKNIMLRK